jgi:aspartyl-tRNA(Asn)/glutamyl-tRNA(Gln) amidotransferase subunit A
VKIYTTIKQTKAAIEKGESSVLDLVNHYISKIETNTHLNAFVEVFANEALASAATVDAKIKSNTAGKLAGLVIGIKDNICFKGHGVQAGSKILDKFVSIYNSTVVERLLAEDAIIIGRLNCDEFAMGSSNENSVYGVVKNPLDNERVPGGSSGGSAAAVAAGLCHAALGSDTGGSIRQPASYTGIVGVKPTYGRVSRHGIVAYASSFDQVGPMTKNVEDAALILEVIAGADAFDSTASHKPVEDYSNHLIQNKK